MIRINCYFISPQRYILNKDLLKEGGSTFPNIIRLTFHIYKFSV